LLKGKGKAVADGESDLKKVIAYVRFFTIFPDRLCHNKLEGIPKEGQLSSGLGDVNKAEKEVVVAVVVVVLCNTKVIQHPLITCTNNKKRQQIVY